MKKANTKTEKIRIDFASIPASKLAELLSEAGNRQKTADEMEVILRKHIASGAPVNPDGTVNLYHYTAWLIRATVCFNPRTEATEENNTK